MRWQSHDEHDMDEAEVDLEREIQVVCPILLSGVTAEMDKESVEAAMDYGRKLLAGEERFGGKPSRDVLFQFVVRLSLSIPFQ